MLGVVLYCTKVQCVHVSCLHLEIWSLSLAALKHRPLRRTGHRTYQQLCLSTNTPPPSSSALLVQRIILPIPFIWTNVLIPCSLPLLTPTDQCLYISFAFSDQCLFHFPLPTQTNVCPRPMSVLDQCLCIISFVLFTAPSSLVIFIE